MNLHQLEAVLALLTSEVHSHGIYHEGKLVELAERGGWAVEFKNTKRDRYAMVKDGDRKKTVYLTHSKTFAKRVDGRGLGGEVKGGDWWGIDGQTLADLSTYLTSELVHQRAIMEASRYHGLGRQYDAHVQEIRDEVRRVRNT